MNSDENSEEDPYAKPLTYSEQVSELLHNGWRVCDIADLTPYVRMCLFLPRDKHGRLKRRDESLPPWVHVDDDGFRVIGPGSRKSFERVFKEINLERGLSKERVEEGWAKYREANPKMGRGGIK